MLTSIPSYANALELNVKKLIMAKKTLERVTKKKAIVYSDASNAANTFDSRIYQKYPLWIAQYGVDKPELYTWKEWAGWHNQQLYLKLDQEKLN